MAGIFFACKFPKFVCNIRHSLPTQKNTIMVGIMHLGHAEP